MNLLLSFPTKTMRRVKTLYERQAAKEIKKHAATIAREAAHKISRRAPRGRTGRLKGGIRAEPSASRHPMRVEWLIVSDAPYTVFANFQYRGRQTPAGYVEFKEQIPKSRRGWLEPKGRRNTRRAMRNGMDDVVANINRTVRAKLRSGVAASSIGKTRGLHGLGRFSRPRLEPVKKVSRPAVGFTLASGHSISVR